MTFDKLLGKDIVVTYRGLKTTQKFLEKTQKLLDTLINSGYVYIELYNDEDDWADYYIFAQLNYNISLKKEGFSIEFFYPRDYQFFIYDNNTKTYVKQKDWKS